MKYFDEIWFPSVRKYIARNDYGNGSARDGYVSVESRKNNTDRECVHVTVKFKNENTLDQWIASPEHLTLVNGLNPYRTRPWLWYACDQETHEEEKITDLDKLPWETVALTPESPGYCFLRPIKR